MFFTDLQRSVIIFNNLGEKYQFQLCHWHLFQTTITFTKHYYRKMKCWSHDHFRSQLKYFVTACSNHITHNKIQLLLLWLNRKHTHKKSSDVENIQDFSCRSMYLGSDITKIIWLSIFHHFDAPLVALLWEWVLIDFPSKHKCSCYSGIFLHFFW